jgi:hypothetical protein
MPWLTTEGSPLLPVLFAVSFLWLSLAVGRRLLIVLKVSQQGSRAERGIIATALGAGVLQYLAFGLGAVGALRVGSLRVAVGVVAVLIARDAWAVALAVSRWFRQRSKPKPWLIAWAAALLPVLVIAGLLALVPTIDPDGLSYHLTVPKRWLQSGSLEYLPTYPYSNAPMGVEMLYTLALAFAGDAAAKCLHFMFGTLGAIGLYLAGKRLKGPITGAVAATLFLVGPVGVSSVLGCAYVEGAAAFAMIASVLAWLLWFQSRDLAYLRSAALLAGVAVTFKITAALLPIALLALTWIAAVDHGRRAGDRDGLERSAAAFSARLLPFMLGPIVPWMARSAIVTGNPLFPLFARWIPSRDFSPDLSGKFDRFNRLMTWGNVIGRDWSIQQRTWVLAGACVVVALLGSVIVFRSRSWMARGTAAVVILVSLAQLSAAGLYLRYSIPLAAVVGLAIAATLDAVLSRRPAPAILLAVTMIGSLAQARRCLLLADSDARGLVKTALGLEGRRAFMLDHLALYPLYEQVNRDLPANAKVMLSCYCGGFYIDRTTFCADMVQDSLRFTSWEDFTSDLRRLGITHVIAPSALATGGPSPAFDRSSTSSITRESEYRFVRPLLTEHGRTRGTASDQGLYELDPALLGAPPMK